MSLKAKIEAVLFVTDKPIRAQAIARIVNADVTAVRQALIELIHDYEERKGGLEIADEDGYSFQIRDEYASLMDEFMPVELSAALIRTLSAIAIKQPISQSEIIRVRGAGAYEHIKELVNRELIAKKEEQGGGRSPILTTTKKFQDYFRLSKDGKDLRNYLKKQVRKADAAAAAAADAGQLVIPSVVTNETDEQLNSRIYLETADMSDEAPDETDVAADVVAADMVAPAVEQPVADDVVAPAVEQPVVAEPPAPVETLSKLAAAAASVRDPEPIQLPDPEPRVLEDEAATAGEAGASKSSVQAMSAKDKSPAMGNSPPRKAKRPATDKLTDLLRKQALFEKQLKLGFVEQETDVTPSDTVVKPNVVDVDTTH